METMMNELTMNEMDEVSGGRVAAGGLKNKPGEKAGYILHKITANDTVWGLAKRYGVTMNAIVKANPSIKNPRLIRTNYWLYIPARA